MASMDGNTVDLDYERGQMASNALDMETQMRFATHYLRQRQISAG
jgi:flagellar basal body rod protein FlgB